MQNIIQLYSHDLRLEVITLLRHTANLRELMNRRPYGQGDLWAIQDTLLDVELTLGTMNSRARIQENAAELAVDLTTALAESHLRTDHPVEYRAASHLAVSLLILEQLSQPLKGTDARFLRAQWVKAVKSLATQALILEIAAEPEEMPAVEALVAA